MNIIDSDEMRHMLAAYFGRLPRPDHDPNEPFVPGKIDRDLYMPVVDKFQELTNEAPHESFAGHLIANAGGSHPGARNYTHVDPATGVHVATQPNWDVFDVRHPGGYQGGDPGWVTSHGMKILPMVQRRQPVNLDSGQWKNWLHLFTSVPGRLDHSTGNYSHQPLQAAAPIGAADYHRLVETIEDPANREAWRKFAEAWGFHRPRGTPKRLSREHATDLHRLFRAFTPHKDQWRSNADGTALPVEESARAPLMDALYDAQGEDWEHTPLGHVVKNAEHTHSRVYPHERQYATYHTGPGSGYESVIPFTQHGIHIVPVVSHGGRRDDGSSTADAIHLMAVATDERGAMHTASAMLDPGEFLEHAGRLPESVANSWRALYLSRYVQRHTLGE